MDTRISFLIKIISQVTVVEQVISVRFVIVIKAY